MFGDGTGLRDKHEQYERRKSFERMRQWIDGVIQEGVKEGSDVNFGLENGSDE